MPTVLCLGGTGQFGLPIARYLAADPVVDRVIVAGRDLAKAQAAAATLGPKGARGRSTPTTTHRSRPRCGGSRSC